MPGFVSSISNGEEIVFAENADFSGNSEPSQVNGLQTNGQLWIGTTALNAGSTHINVGKIVSNSPGLVVGYTAPNITLTVAAASDEILTLTPDADFDGSAATPISPQTGNVNILSYNPSFATVTDTLNSTGLATGDLKVEHRAWLTGFVVDPSATVGTRGTFQTIQAAITAAVAGQTVFIRASSTPYTENLTLKADVNLTAFTCDAFNPNVIISGTITMTVAGSVAISGIRLQTNSAALLAVTGTAASKVTLINCFLNCLNNTGITFSSSDATSEINIFFCRGDLGTTGIGLYTDSSAGTLKINNTTILNSGGSSTVNTKSAGVLSFNNSTFTNPLTYSSSSTISSPRYCDFNTSAQNVTALTTSGTGTFTCQFCNFNTGTASAISVGTGTIVRVSESVINGSNTNMVTGAGQFTYAGITFTSTSSTINTTTQVPDVTSNDAIKVVTPGAYPYTTVPQDGLILVDSSSARTITPLASPTTGQKHRIKDAGGLAGTNNITITPSGKNIDGAASFVISTNYGSIDIVYTGSEWSVL